MRLAGKRALITGGARGIGRGIAERFLQEGARVYILDVREEELQILGSGLANYGDALAYSVCDLADLDSIPDKVAAAIAKWDGLDIVVNNAGIAVREPFLEIALDRWTKIIDVNLNAMFLVSQLAARDMVARGIGGSIINMSSKNGVKGSASLAHYNASKGGVVLLTESMAVDLAPYGIRANAVAPGNIMTPLDQELKEKEGRDTSHVPDRNPLGRLGTIEEIAHVFLFLASDEASFVTGSTFVADGGHLANASDV